jgi:hypothetical protein
MVVIKRLNAIDVGENKIVQLLIVVVEKWRKNFIKFFVEKEPKFNVRAIVADASRFLYEFLSRRQKPKICDNKIVLKCALNIE